MKLDTKEKIGKWLDSMRIKKCTINDDLTVDVYGNVDLDRQDFENFPVKFGKVKGYFDCNSCPNLASLEGSPSKVDGSFYCYNCPKLTSLKGAPKTVGGGFSCSNCVNLVSVIKFPKINSSLYYSNTPFENLFKDTNFKDFAKMNDQEKENFIIEGYKENRINEKVFKANVSKETFNSYKGLSTGKKFGL